MTNAEHPRSTYWWVNQGDTYKQERKAGILWAPKIGRKGQRVPHWATMLEVQPGDSQALPAILRHVADLGSLAAAAVPRLRQLTESTDDWVRTEAAHALWRTSGEPAEAVAVLTTVARPLTEHRCFPVMHAALRYLAGTGAPAVSAVPIARAVLDDPRRLAHFGSWRTFVEDEEFARRRRAPSRTGGIGNVAAAYALRPQPGRGPRRSGWTDRCPGRTAFDHGGIGIYLASDERYTESELPRSFGPRTGTPEEGIEHTFIPYAGPNRQPRGGPRLRLRPLPQRPHRLAPTPDELTPRTT